MEQYFNSEDLKRFYPKVGKNVFIHKSCVITNVDSLEIGDDVRIDAFCVLSSSQGIIEIGPQVHISTHCLFIGGTKGIKLGKNCNIAAGCKIYAASDDFDGLGLIGPQVELGKRFVHQAPIHLDDYSCLGANSVALPGALLGWGSVALASSIVTKSCLHKGIVYSGAPAKMLRLRRLDFLKHIDQREIPREILRDQNFGVKND